MVQPHLAYAAHGASARPDPHPFFAANTPRTSARKAFPEISSNAQAGQQPSRPVPWHQSEGNYASRLRDAVHLGQIRLQRRMRWQVLENAVTQGKIDRIIRDAGEREPLCRTEIGVGKVCLTRDSEHSL